MWRICYDSKCKELLLDDADMRLKEWYCAKHCDATFSGMTHENLLRCAVHEIEGLRTTISVQKDQIRAADAQIAKLEEK
jgi:hypothetical protein